MCIDQFGWTEEETILKFGILVAGVGLMCIFLFASVGPLVNRIAQCSGRDQNVQKVKRKSDFLFQKYFSITYLGSLPITW